MHVCHYGETQELRYGVTNQKHNHSKAGKISVFLHAIEGFIYTLIFLVLNSITVTVISFYVAISYVYKM